MIQTLGELIDKTDTAEAVRDYIAAILALNIEEQKQLAIDALRDPEPWDLRVFLEASTPWEQFREGENQPIVNVFFESTAVNPARSDVVERQTYEGQYVIDVIANGQSRPDGESGQITGDRDAAIKAQRAARLVRNILMAGQNTYLQLRPLVGSRMITGIRMMGPPKDLNVLDVIACRLTLAVTFSEYSPQVQPVDLDLVSLTVNNETGQLILAADYDYTGGG